MYFLKKFFIALPDLARVFCGDSGFRRLLLLFQLWYFALTRKTILRGKQMKFTFKFLDKSFNIYIESIVDLAALHEVFVQEEYNWEPIEDPKIIIDLGAHFGDTVLYYHLKYPNAQIYAVEPTPETFKRLQENVSSIENITSIQAGIGECDGFANLNIVPSSLGNSFKSRPNVKNIVSVRMYTLPSLFEKFNIGRADIVKFDIEGAEESLFTAGDPEYFANAYIGEVHSDLISINPEIFIGKFKTFIVEKDNLSSTRFILKAVTNTPY